MRLGVAGENQDESERPFKRRRTRCRTLQSHQRRSANSYGYHYLTWTRAAVTAALLLLFLRLLLFFLLLLSPRARTRRVRDTRLPLFSELPITATISTSEF